MLRASVKDLTENMGVLERKLQRAYDDIETERAQKRKLEAKLGVSAQSQQDRSTDTN